MGADQNEEKALRSAALQNAGLILEARQRVEKALLEAKEALEKRTQELSEALAASERAQAALHEQRQWLQVTLASIGDAVITTDVAGCVTYLNRIAEQLTGWCSPEALGRPLEEVFRVINERTSQVAANPIERVLREGINLDLANHTALLAKDGRQIAIEDSAAPIRDMSGAIVGAVMVFHDVTARRQAENALRQTAQRLHLALDAGQLGDWSWDPATDLVTLGPRAAEIFGLPAQQATTWQAMRELLIGQDAERARIAVEHSLASHSDYSIEYQAQRPDGALCWIAARGRGVYGEQDQILGMSGVVQDITERKQAEALHRRLAAVVESSDDAIISKTLEGIIVTWNAGAERMFGYTADEVVGEPITLLIPPDRLAEEPEILRRLAAGERIDHYESVRAHKDGRLLEVSLTVSPIRDPDGRVMGASKIARDITLQKRAEAAMREESRILELLNHSGAALASHLDLQTLLQAVTDGATALTGAKFGAFFYTHRDAQGDAFMLYTLSGAPREAFARFGHPRATALFGPTFNGEPVIRSADILKDPRYGRWAPHHGMPKGHLPVRSYLAIPVISRTGEVLGGLFFGHPEVGKFDERSERLLIGFAAQAAVAIDNARLYEAAQREIARREQAEQALRETDRRKDEFLATLAHELRNPLAPIRQAALISQAPAATEAQKRWSHEVVTRQVLHMSLLLDDLLDVSRITRGTLELRKKRTELASVIDAAVETARPVIDAKRHRLEIDVPAQTVHFEADALRLAQVLSNLLTNAAKYTDPEGTIRLRVTCSTVSIEISVADTGIGISASSLPDIFHMFSQVKSHQDRSDGGLGIGLALAQGLVRLHGGTIEARSAGLGHGSEFTVHLPIGTAAASSTGEAPGVGSSVRSASRRVLIADDNRDAADSLAMLLRMEGHEVSVAQDGAEAVALFATAQPEYAILDIGMPGLNGYDVARRMRKESSGRPLRLIAVTGWGQQADKALAFAAGFDHHFTKPLEPDKLIELLRD